MPLCAIDHTAIRLIVHFYFMLAVYISLMLKGLSSYLTARTLYDDDRMAL